MQVLSLFATLSMISAFGAQGPSASPSPSVSPPPKIILQVRTNHSIPVYIYGEGGERYLLSPGQYVVCTPMSLRDCHVSAEDSNGAQRKWTIDSDRRLFEEITDVSKINLKIESQGRTTTVFQYSFNTQPDCEGGSAVGSPCKFWPNKEAKIEKLLDTQLVEVPAPFSSDFQWSLSNKIEGSYKPDSRFNENGVWTHFDSRPFIGWVHHGNLTHGVSPPTLPNAPDPRLKKPPTEPRKPAPKLTAKPKPKLDPCPDGSCHQPPVIPLRQEEDLESIMSAVSAGSLEQLSKELAPELGVCKLNPPTGPWTVRRGIKHPPEMTAPKFSATDTSMNPIYNQIIVPLYAGTKSTPKFYKGRAISELQRQEIDTLARTLFGEIGHCFASGLQYAMAAARTIVNRAESKKATFSYELRAKHSPNKTPEIIKKSPLVNACIAPKAYSTWNNEFKHFKKVLCPPSRMDMMYVAGRKPFKNEHKSWQQAVQIAAEVVLETKEFKRKTEGLKFGNTKLTHYTSGMDAPWAGSTEVFNVNIPGHGKINRGSCVRLWHVKNP